ncbi:hypothetical protein [Tardiphaga sp. 841_E9_N1_2]|uniref:hypothetical protein n=1 Tax=Tardiphaga sp. 841_E9_N1_2 TaxID=3240762 RepID=UPI003F23824A
MSDIILGLLKYYAKQPWADQSNETIRVKAELLRQSAELIECLIAERDAALLALKPFAEVAADVHENAFDADNLWESPAAMSLTAGHIRAASAVFATERQA